MFEVSIKIAVMLANKGPDDSEIRPQTRPLLMNTSALDLTNATGSRTTSSLSATKSTVFTSYHSILVFNFQNLTSKMFSLNFNGNLIILGGFI